MLFTVIICQATAQHGHGKDFRDSLPCYLLEWEILLLSITAFLFTFVTVALGWTGILASQSHGRQGYRLSFWVHFGVWRHFSSESAGFGWRFTYFLLPIFIAYLFITDVYTTRETERPGTLILFTLTFVYDLLYKSFQLDLILSSCQWKVSMHRKSPCL